MKTAVFVLLVLGVHSVAFAGEVSAPVPVVQQTLEIALNKTNCPMDRFGGFGHYPEHYSAFCVIASSQLGLPGGGQIVLAQGTDVVEAKVDKGNIFISPADNQTSLSTIQTLLLANQIKIKLIYQGPQISK